MKVQKRVLPVVFLCMVVFFAGCLNTQPVSQPVQTSATTSQQAVVQQGTPASSVAPPVSATSPPAVISQSQAPVYVKRPYGFEPYSYQAGYQATLQESHLDKDPATGERTIVGTVKNTGSDTIGLVAVTINLYNNQGFVIGSPSVEIYYLQPGKTWQFRTDPITQSDYSYYEIADVFTG